MRSHSGVGRILLLAGILSFTGAGCAQDPDVSVSEPPAGVSSAPSADGSAASELRLGLTEWGIETGGVRLRPGVVQVRVLNAGGTRHDVVITGKEGRWASPVLGPGEMHLMEITAAPGEQLDLVCTLTGHEAQGMHTSIRVDEGSGGP